jgi:hypothetical protein
MAGTTRRRPGILGLGALAVILLAVWLIVVRRRPIDPREDYPQQIRAIESRVVELERYKAHHGSYPPPESVTPPCESCFYARAGDGFEMASG